VHVVLALLNYSCQFHFSRAVSGSSAKFIKVMIVINWLYSDTLIVFTLVLLCLIWFLHSMRV
jgi:hypothetical protein